MSDPAIIPSTRRDFLRTTSGAVLAGAWASQAGFPAVARGAPDSRKLKIGVVGCGYRGTGAASQALTADSNVELFAMGDVFADKLASSLNTLTKMHKERVNVPAARQFIGLDAYQKVIENCDLVVLATPPGFRPQHLRAAVDAGRHVFSEKPVATDAPGVRSVMESAALAEKKGLALKSGFNWRHYQPMREFMGQIHGGAVGALRAIYATYYVAVLQPIPAGETGPKPGMTDLEWQLRRWYNFVWLGGDGYVEQTVHAVDWLMWMMHETPPLRCVAVGGRQVPGNGGNIFDHIEVNYEWPDDVRGFIGARQQNGCFGDTSLYVMGAKGVGEFRRHRPVPEIRGEKPWQYSGPSNLMHQTEHDELFACLRAGKPINDGASMARSTLCAIMGRMAAYTGQQITWDMALNSQEKLVPEKLEWDMKLPIAPMARPGQMKFF
ncbi:MAG: Gfo/Idh/MocA family oxidoreductase [Verrucomicrobia bacterium]|nr:Gfo/Idh/MocA family oxidoreductase [Verrucomicrobiota bacterium]